MSGNIVDMKVMRTLVKREFQEQRVLFLYIPIAVTVLMFVAFLAKLITSAQAGFLWEGFSFAPRPPGSSAPPVDDSIVGFANLSAEMRAFSLDLLFTTTSQLLITLFWLSAVFYFLLTLYQSRKDRSILFWNSMPVSDAQTIISKLLACQLGCLSVYLACMLALQVLLMLSLIVYGSLAGVDAWQTFAEPSQFFSRYLAMIVASLLGLLWALPIHGWLLFTSARSPAVPFLWAAGPIVTILALETYLSAEMPISSVIGSHILPMAIFDMSDGKALASIAQNVPWSELTVGVALGLALVYAAIRFNRPDEI